MRAPAMQSFRCNEENAWKFQAQFASEIYRARVDMKV
jgi:hypothetical protein